MARSVGGYDIQKEEVEDLQPLENNFYRRVQQMVDKFAATRMGQFAIEKSDRLLQIVETTAKWSLPKDKQTTELQRPIGWILFLWLIVVLRLTRFWLSMAAMFIGNNPVSAQDMVYFMQTRRRKLRAIRLQGIRAITEREAKAKGKTSFFSVLSKTLLKAVCIKGNYAQTDQNIRMLRQHWCNKSPATVNAEENHEKLNNKKRLCENEDDDDDDDKRSDKDHHLSFEQKLANYADIVSDDDSDFVPPAHDSTNDDDDDDSDESSSSNSSAVSAENDEVVFKSVLLDQLKRLKELDGIENLKNGHDVNTEAEEDAKMTPGHKSAAVTEIKQNSLPNNLATVVTDLGEHDSMYTLNLCATAGTGNVAGTPVATDSSLNTFESPTLGSASSSEDIFYSPIGSPMEYNDMSHKFIQHKQQQHHIHNSIPIPTISIQCATPNKSAENDENIKQQSSQDVIEQKSQDSNKVEQQAEPVKKPEPAVSNHKYHQHQPTQNQKYRGKNRRKFNANP